MSTTISPQATEPAATDSTHPAQVAAVEEKKKAEPRPYIVLKKQDLPALGPATAAANPLMWEQVATIDATSAEQAIRRAAETPGTSFLNAEGPTTLVAVPSRSFNPVTVAVQTSTQIILS